MKTTKQLAEDLESRGADLDALALIAVRIAGKRGYVTAGLTNGTSLIAAKHRGLLKRDRRFKGDARYTLTPRGLLRFRALIE